MVFEVFTRNLETGVFKPRVNTITVGQAAMGTVGAMAVGYIVGKTTEWALKKALNWYIARR